MYKRLEKPHLKILTRNLFGFSLFIFIKSSTIRELVLMNEMTIFSFLFVKPYTNVKHILHYTKLVTLFRFLKFTYNLCVHSVN